jgi:hypothetical protein
MEPKNVHFAVAGNLKISRSVIVAIIPKQRLQKGCKMSKINGAPAAGLNEKQLKKLVNER